MKFQVGDNLHCVYSNNTNNYEVTGTVIKIIKPSQVLTENEMLVFAGIKVGNPAYKSVEGKHCTVTRLVLETHSRGNVIVPINHNGNWTYRELLSHPEDKEIITADYAKVEGKILEHVPDVSETFENFDVYTHLAEKHKLERSVVKFTVFKDLYTPRKNIVKETRAQKAAKELLIAKMEDALEEAGLIGSKDD